MLMTTTTDEDDDYDGVLALTNVVRYDELPSHERTTSCTDDKGVDV